MRQERKVYKVLVGKPKRKSPLERPRSRCENKIRMDLWEIGWRLWSEFNWLGIGTVGEIL
jgi:hypothetical protein